MSCLLLGVKRTYGGAAAKPLSRHGRTASAPHDPRQRAARPLSLLNEPSTRLALARLLGQLALHPPGRSSAAIRPATH
jgi:hypothetical protein